jgi:malate synthase
MEDAATAEIARAQLWQWIHHGASTDTHNPITLASVTALADRAGADLAPTLSPVGRTALRQARTIFDHLVFDQYFHEFLTLQAYDALTNDKK